MTQDSLIEIGYGAEAKSDILNDNFTYLDDKIGAEIDALKGGETSDTIISLRSAVNAVDSYMQSGGAVPAGTVIMFGGNFTPTGYIFCNGYSYNKNDYPKLFAAIGYTYGGSGDNFNVPNVSDARYPIGWTTSGSYADNQSSAQTVNVSGNTGGQSANHHHPHVMGGMSNSEANASDHYHHFSGSGTYYRTDQVKYITFRFCIKY